jgi:outer membrane autotransporter protein
MNNIFKVKRLKILLITTSTLVNFIGEVYAANGVSNRVGDSYLNSDHWGLGVALQNGDNVQVGDDNSVLRYEGEVADFIAIEAENPGDPNRAIQNAAIQNIRLNNLNLDGHNNVIIRLKAIELSHNNITDTSIHNRKVRVEFDKFNYFDHQGVYTNAASIFKINGNNISALGDIYFGTSTSHRYENGFLSGARDGKVVFESPVTYTGNIYSKGDYEQDKLGTVTIDNDVTFINKIGFNPILNTIAEIATIQISDQRALTAKESIYLNGSIELNGLEARLIVDSTNTPIIISSNINTMGITNDKYGIIETIGRNNIEMPGVLGSPEARIGLIKMTDTSEVRFAQNIYATKIELDRNRVIFSNNVGMFARDEENPQLIADRGILEFTGDGVIELVADKNIEGDIQTSADGNGTIKYGGDRNLDAQVGTDNARLKSIQFSTPGANIRLSTNAVHAGELRLLYAEQMLTIDDNINFAGTIAGLGTLTFAGRSAVAQIGELNARVARVRVGIGNADFNRPVYADVIEVNGDAQVRILDRILSTDHILLNNRRANVTIVNGLDAPVTIKAAAAGNGSVIFAANGNIGAIGEAGSPVDVVEFRNDSNHTLHNNIYTNNIIFDKGVIAPQNNIIQIVVPQAAINHVPAGWQYAGNALVVVNAQPQPEPAIPQIQPLPPPQQQAAAQQVVGQRQQVANQILKDIPVDPLNTADTKSDMMKIKKLLLQNIDTEILPNNQTAQQHASDKILIDKIVAPIIHDYRNIEGAINQFNNAGVKFSEEEIAAVYKDTIVANKPKEQQVILYAVSMSPLSSAERQVTFDRMEEAVQAQIKVAEQVTEILHHTIDDRMNELGLNQQKFMVSMEEGVAAGDEHKHELQGVWIRGNCGTSKQSSNKGIAGYKGAIAGGTIGSDFELSEQNIIGVAYSNVRSAFKYKQSRTGDKINGDSHILSLYSGHQLNSNLSLKTMFSAGLSKITTKRLVVNGVANGKVKNKSYSAGASLSYNITPTENISLIPHIGLRYGHYKDKAYSEYGSGVHNLSVAAKSSDSLDAITGLNMIMPQRLSETLIAIPSIHGFIESNLLNKRPKVQAKLMWMDNYFENSASTGDKLAKFSYNLGGGVMLKHNNIEFSANYNCNLRKKYQGQQGSIKFKVLF